jgi:hypothetical protein
MGSGAFFGAAAFPNRRRATSPDTTGPEAGKRSAAADGTITATTATIVRACLQTGLINSSGAIFYKRIRADEKKKIQA